MANTPNLGLPLIDGNMTADVPRDHNALANALDTAITELHEDIAAITPESIGAETPAGAQDKANAAAAIGIAAAGDAMDAAVTAQALANSAKTTADAAKTIADSAQGIISAATPNRIANTLVKRDVNNRFKASDPMDADDVTNKGFVVNGVSVGSTADPNTTLESYILTNHVNGPGGGIYWHIQTLFYSSRATNSNRSQIAISYNGGVSAGVRMMIRQNYDNVWTAWREVSYGAAEVRVNAGQLEYNVGGVWKVSGGGAYLTASDNVLYEDATQRTSTDYSQGPLVWKWIPPFDGEVKIQVELMASTNLSTSRASIISMSRVNWTASNGGGGWNADVGNVNVLNYLTPLGTKFNGGSSAQPAQFAELNTKSISFVTLSVIVLVRQGTPIFMTLANQGDDSTPKTATIRNISARGTINRV